MLRKFAFSAMAAAVLASGAWANTDSNSVNGTSKAVAAELSARSVASDITAALQKYDFIDMVVSGKTVYMLATINTAANSYYTDPDGTKSYQKDIYLVKVDTAGKVTQVKLDTLNPQNGTLTLGVGGDSIGTLIRVFVNHKVQNGTYAMDGRIFNISDTVAGMSIIQRDDNLAFYSVVFTNANMGWFPKLNANNNDVEHFSFTGYYRYVNTTNKGSVQPSTMSDEYNAYQKAHSNNIMPESNKATLISKVAAMYPDSTIPIPAPPSNCVSDAVSLYVGTGWNMLGALSDGCTRSGFSSAGYTAWWYDPSSSSYSSHDSIKKGSGFWMIKK